MGKSCSHAYGLSEKKRELPMLKEDCEDVSMLPIVFCVRVVVHPS